VDRGPAIAVQAVFAVHFDDWMSEERFLRLFHQEAVVSTS
jgi:hypothetical protein